MKIEWTNNNSKIVVTHMTLLGQTTIFLSFQKISSSVFSSNSSIIIINLFVFDSSSLFANVAAVCGFRVFAFLHAILFIYCKMIQVFHSLTYFYFPSTVYLFDCVGAALCCSCLVYDWFVFHLILHFDDSNSIFCLILNIRLL